MSINLGAHEEPIKMSAISKVQNLAKQTLKAYYERPVYYLFFASLPVLLVLLFCKVNLPAILYVLISCLGISTYYKKINLTIKKRLWRTRTKKT